MATCRRSDTSQFKRFVFPELHSPLDGSSSAGPAGLGVVTSCVPAGNQLIPSDCPQGSDQVIWWPTKLAGVLLQLYCYTVNLCCNHFFQYCCNVTCYCTKLINRIIVTVMLLLTHATEVLQVFFSLLQSAHFSSIRKGVIYPAVQSVVGVTSLMSFLDVQFWSTKGVVL